MFDKLFLTFFLQTIACLMLVTTPVLADKNQQKQSQLTQEITAASKTLRSSKASSNKLRKKVVAAEDKLHNISNKLHHTEQKINRLTTKLTKSNAQKQKLLKQTTQQKNALAQQMLALYTSGKQSHLRLLLKQDDPSDISRTIKYFEYLNKHRLKRIQAIDKQLEKIETVQLQINIDTQELKALQKKQSNRKTSLKNAVRTKEKALKKQSKIVLSDKQKLSKLKNEELNLKNIIEKLARDEKKARLKREKIKLAKEKSKKARAEKVAIAQAKLKTKKKKVSTHKEKVTRHYIPNKPFSKLKGKLSWPVRGSFLHKYNQVRNSKQKWKAVVISAPGGTRVHAVARGKIEYSGRYKGYGYMVIIRHDNNYRSIYGYNRSVYKKTGDIVKAGEVIAAVGNTGSIKKSALYFEIRKNTAYQNPAKWCK